MGKLDKLLLSKRVFYFRAFDDDAVLKFVPGKGYFIKWKGGRPEASIDPKKSNLLVDSLLQFEETKKDVYDNW